ncbi:Interleukin-1 receptor-associated kinase 3 [Bagarius yarrelli]|uniref:Beta-2-microglobulin n=1 Tax=Bagarius yarrelli TaxID=175774 RepID=A0A556THF2_BAGYA|nr:Interleukin-1 receptor-associated kinase 3 [Bagarius yarrelli]
MKLFTFFLFGILCISARAKESSPKVQVYSYGPGEFGKDNYLICHVSGFHPPDISIELLMDDVEIPGANQSDLAFEQGWMFYLTKSVPFKPQQGKEYICKVRHMQKTQTFVWPARILPSWLEVRCTEMHAAAGKSPTHELLWSWAQQNKTLADLMRVLEDMGHYRALEIFRSYDSYKDAPRSSSVQNISQPQNDKPRQDSDLNHECVFGEGKRKKAWLTYSEVKVGTRNFHQDLKIGGNAFAEVYKGKRGNENFVVKLFKQENKKSWKVLWERFRTEIEVLQFSDHPNILELWGGFSEDERYCLVYPFMPNGSLFHKLHNQVN